VSPDNRGGAVTLRVITSGGRPFAVLAEGPDGRFLLPPVIYDPSGNVIEGHQQLMPIAGYCDGAEIPALHVRTSGELAAIDQQLAALRDQLCAQPWPPLDSRDDPRPPGACQLRGRIGRLNQKLGPEPQAPGGQEFPGPNPLWWA
jgi:hypothetical protein